MESLENKVYHKWSMESYWWVVFADITKAGAQPTITLKSGSTLTGNPKKDLSPSGILFLETSWGYHVINIDEVAAVSASVPHTLREYYENL